MSLAWVCDHCERIDRSRAFPPSWKIFRVRFGALIVACELCPTCQADPSAVRSASEQMVLVRTGTSTRCRFCWHPSAMHIYIDHRYTILDGSCQWPGCPCKKLRQDTPQHEETLLT